VTAKGQAPSASPFAAGPTLTQSFAAGDVTAKVSDFGLSKRMKSKQEYMPNIRQGTPFFMAPELSQKHQLHQQSDVYGFGVTMWELMMGYPVSLEMCALP
jgi:serine/threonine protein kinase